MKRVCFYCGRSFETGDMWCQESYCTIENMPPVLDHGEELADISIKKALVVTRTAVVYEATRYAEDILVKIAHEGMEEKLINEAILLRDLQGAKIKHVALPTLLPAYNKEDINTYPYAETVFRGARKYFFVMDHLEGDLLSGMLMKNSQPWIGNVGYIGMVITEALVLLHANGYAHLGLAPSHILVRVDKENYPRPVLLDLGIATKFQTAQGYWHRRYMPPAYTAPELLRSQPNIKPAADVYGLGTIFYEMLAGRPAVPHHLLSDVDVIRKALRGQRDPIQRTDIDPEIGALVVRAIGPADSRPQTVADFAAELSTHFKSVPVERPARWQDRTDWHLIRMGASILIVLALLLTTGLIFLVENN